MRPLNEPPYVVNGEKRFISIAGQTTSPIEKKGKVVGNLFIKKQTPKFLFVYFYVLQKSFFFTQCIQTFLCP